MYAAKVTLVAPQMTLSFVAASRIALLSTAHIFVGRQGEPGPPGTFKETDFVTQPEADADFQTA